jgi:transketolase
LVDCNGIQADGPVTVAIEPVPAKFEAFGFTTYEVNGNDMTDLVQALHRCRASTGGPKAIIMRTTPGFGVPSIVRRPRAHFVRVTDDEWGSIMAELESNR